MALTAKQQAFVDEYLIDLNATQACIRAGYSAKTAEQQGPRLLGNVGVAKAIAAHMQARSEKAQIDATYVLNRLVEIDQMDVLDILQNDGTLKPVHEWPKIWRQYLTGIDLAELFEGSGDERQMIGVLKKVKWPDKVRNLELLGKHVNVNAFRERLDVNLNVSLAERMRKARERSGSSA